MKILIILSSLLGVISYKFDFEAIGHSVSDVIEEIFTKSEIRFDVFLVGESSDKIDKILTTILKRSQNFPPQKVIRVRQQQGDEFPIYQSAVFLTDSRKTSSDFIKNTVLSNVYPKKLKFLIFSNSFAKSLPIFSSDIYWDDTPQVINFAYIMMEQNEEVQLLSTEWFTEEICGKLQLVALNSFNIKSRKWKSQLKIAEKFFNFHECLLVFLVNIDGCELHTQYFYEINETLGFLPDLVMDIARHGNASTFIQSPLFDPNYKFGFNLYKPSKHVKSHVCVAERPIFAMALYDSLSHVISVYDQTSYVFVTTPAENYSSYEKLLLPFDELTWTFLITIFAIAFLLIFLINQSSTWVRETVYGKRVEHAAFNVIGAFFGIGQVKLPSGNFPRILLMFFVMFCLVMRTAYQGESKE